jgi:hypothetical protein
MKDSVPVMPTEVTLGFAKQMYANGQAALIDGSGPGFPHFKSQRSDQQNRLYAAALIHE